MSDRLQEIRDRLEQATQGEWRVCGRDPGNPRIDAHWDDGDYLMVCEQAGRNAEFLAHAPADIRWLLERLSELETECVLRDPDLTRQLNEARSVATRGLIRPVHVHVVERTRPPTKLHLTPDEWEDIANS
jgi:hypothetical protein